MARSRTSCAVRRFVEAIRGELVIVAEFPDGAVRISQFAGLDRAS